MPFLSFLPAIKYFGHFQNPDTLAVDIYLLSAVDFAMGIGRCVNDDLLNELMQDLSAAFLQSATSAFPSSRTPAEQALLTKPPSTCIIHDMHCIMCIVRYMVQSRRDRAETVRMAKAPKPQPDRLRCPGCGVKTRTRRNRAGCHRPAKRYHEKLPGHHRSRQRGHRLARLRGLRVVYIQHNSLSAGTRTFKSGTHGGELVPEMLAYCEKKGCAVMTLQEAMQA